MCVCVCVCVCVSMSGSVPRPLHGSLYMQSRIFFFPLTALDFDLRLTPPVLGHDTRSSVCKEKGVMCGARVRELSTACACTGVHKCVPPLACS